jgi:hypothetical protein
MKESEDKNEPLRGVFDWPETCRECTNPNLKPQPQNLKNRTPNQVILKPDPGNAQELYLGSLEALGIDIRAHDVRCVCVWGGVWCIFLARVFGVCGGHVCVWCVCVCATSVLLLRERDQTDPTSPNHD